MAGSTSHRGRLSPASSTPNLRAASSSSGGEPAIRSKKGTGKKDDHFTPRKNRQQAEFELALEASRVARTEALLALRDQQALLERSFPKHQPGEMKGAARALIVGTTKAIQQLVSSTEAMELEALGMRSAMARDQLSVMEDEQHARGVLTHQYELEIATLGKDLRIAEVVDKQEMLRMKARLEKALEEERAALARLAEKATIQSEGHLVTIRELEEAMDTHRTELHAQLDVVRGQLRASEEARHQLVGEKRAAEEAYHVQLTELTRERAKLVSALQEETLRSEGLVQMIQEEQQLHQATLRQVASLEQRIALAQETSTLAQETLEEKVAEMQKLQAWALASSSARALQNRSPHELSFGESSARRTWDRLVPAGESVSALSRASSALQLMRGGGGGSALPSPASSRLPSARAAARSRGLLYTEVTRSRMDGQQLARHPSTPSLVWA